MNIRNDGLELRLNDGSYKKTIKIIKPIEYVFEDWRIQLDLAEKFSSFRFELKRDMERKNIRDNLNTLSDFFDLDLKRVRMKKLNKINEN
jgi:hypothetical protein